MLSVLLGTASLHLAPFSLRSHHATPLAPLLPPRLTPPARSAPPRLGVSALARELSQRPPPEEIVAAVEQLYKRRGRASRWLTPADVCAASGIALPAATAGLSALAAALAGEEGVSIAASERGELLYAFPADVRSALRKRSLAFAARDVRDALLPKAVALGRFAFGLSLFASIAVVVTAITVISASSESSQRSERRQSVDLWLPLDLLLPRPYLTPPSRMSLPEAIFSFVFGDGDPNPELRATRLQLIAEAVRANGGAVVAEQLAPFLEPPPLPASPASPTEWVDESWVLPALVELGGVPEVSDDGTIVYTFPELSTFTSSSSSSSSASSSSASSSAFSSASSASSASASSDILRERLARFSHADEGQLAAAASLGLLNLVLCLALGAQLASLPAGLLLPRSIQAVRAAYAALLAYASAYALVPAGRAWRIRRHNAAVERRNAARAAWRDALAAGGARLKAKLAAAREFRKALRVVGEKDIAYDSAKGIDEQPTLASPTLDDFDRRLNAKP